ncbi:3-oxoacyl-[acyl-carrier-protein] reductase FabG [bioreactor metagenome]|uniref:3-oxoacyl-[acyl-carrier-protein] reductase FabG n=1 Tax=bioreactor metagenome TaxID=1076179 RepID=A0A644YFF0_9ZZZZ|nr:SDR family oxidoreductase [Candidatus Metalachnospira sp.]
MEIKGKVALITGGGTGVGKGVALRLAQEGTNICINYAHSEKEAYEAKAEVEALGVKCNVYKADVSNDEDDKAMIEAILKDFGQLDILVNNAGRTHFVNHSDLEGMKSEYFDDIFALNVKGTFFMCRAAAAALKKSHGVIINITSIAGVTGLGSSIAYAASKAAEISITKSLARVLAPEVRVIGVAPGIVLTRWVDGHSDHIDKLAGETPLQKVAEPADIAQTVYALIAHADFVTGQNIIVDGGAFI